MKDSTWGMILFVLFIVCGFLTIYGYIRGAKEEERMKNVCWTSFEINSWDNMYSQKVSRVVLGLRRDGVVVWKEELLNQKPNTCIFYEEDMVRVGGAKNEK